MNPWGTAPGDPNFTAKNTDIVSLNANVIGLLAAGDVRKNYILIGTTWAHPGGPPSTNQIVGTTQMANSTMETFFQPSNCFECHSDATGNMRSILRFLWDLESDPTGLKVEDVVISSRDNDGQQLSLGIQMSGLVLGPPQPQQQARNP